MIKANIRFIASISIGSLISFEEYLTITLPGFIFLLSKPNILITDYKSNGFVYACKAILK